MNTRPIRVDDEVYAYLVRTRALLAISTGKNVPMWVAAKFLIALQGL